MTIYTDNNISLKAKGLYLLIEYLNSKNEDVTRAKLCEMTSTKEKSLKLSNFHFEISNSHFKHIYFLFWNTVILFLKIIVLF